MKGGIQIISRLQSRIAKRANEIRELDYEALRLKNKARIAQLEDEPDLADYYFREAAAYRREIQLFAKDQRLDRELLQVSNDGLMLAMYSVRDEGIEFEPPTGYTLSKESN